MTGYLAPNFRIRIPAFNERSWRDDYCDGFRWIVDGMRGLGVIAHYAKFVPLAMAELKALRARVAALEARP